MDHNKVFILVVSAIAVTALLYLLSRIWGFMKELIAAIRRQGEGGRIMTHGDPAAGGVYTVLAVRDFYDGMYQGIKILAEAKGGARRIFWTLHDPFAQDGMTSPYQFFDTLDRGDRISVSVDGDGEIRITLFYG